MRKFASTAAKLPTEGPASYTPGSRTETGTSACVGPGTIEQLESYLPAADITLSSAVLDPMDELVAPPGDHQPR
jgi:aryl-alcohol dehydrogenase-like predicted oxidoreductase